jgi:hypothetical protein
MGRVDRRLAAAANISACRPNTIEKNEYATIEVQP